VTVGPVDCQLPWDRGRELNSSFPHFGLPGIPRVRARAFGGSPGRTTPQPFPLQYIDMILTPLSF
jgi:hypothetical protein